jgi:hypothetical protein
VHETRCGLILHDLEDKADSFYNLTMVEMGHGKLAMGTTSGGALAPGTSPAAGLPPPSIRLARGAPM